MKPYSKEFVGVLVDELTALAAEIVQARAALDQARLTAQMRYEILTRVHKYAVLQGIDVPPLPEPPVLYAPGIAKQQKIAKARQRHLAMRAASTTREEFSPVCSSGESASGTGGTTDAAPPSVGRAR